MTCERCLRTIENTDAHGLFLCPLEPRPANVVWADDIPGGVLIYNGLCNEDGTPRRFYSRSEMRLACKVKGVIPYHDVYTEGGNQTLSDARQRDSWLKSGEAQRAKRDRDEARQEKRLARDREAAMSR